MIAQFHKHSRLRHRSLRAEWLEGRNPLAGDVTAALLGNTLVIEGDASANALVLSEGSHHQLTLSGSGSGDAATTINGSSDPFQIPALDANSTILVHLGDGNDSFTFGGDVNRGGDSNTDNMAGMNKGVGSLLANSQSLRLQGNWMLDLGAGDDTITGNVNSQGQMTILGAEGADQVSLHDSRVGSLLVLADPLSSAASSSSSTGSADVISLNNLRARQDVSLYTMGGDDQISLAGDVRIQGNLDVNSGLGVDHVGLDTTKFVVHGSLSLDPITSDDSGSNSGTENSSTKDTPTLGSAGADTNASPANHSVDASLANSAALNQLSAAGQLTADGMINSSLDSSLTTNDLGLGAQATAFSNAALNDPLLSGNVVGAGNAALLLNSAGNLNANLGDVVADSSVTADSGLNAATQLGATGLTNNLSATNATNVNSPLLDNLATTALAQSFVPASNLGTLTNPLTTNSSVVDPRNSGLLQNAAALNNAANSFNPSAGLSPLATDSIFNNLNEADLIGSAARNPSFLPAVSDNTSFDQALNQLALSQTGFAPSF